jgi:hypothetical protein
VRELLAALDHGWSSAEEAVSKRVAKKELRALYYQRGRIISNQTHVLHVVQLVTEQVGGPRQTQMLEDLSALIRALDVDLAHVDEKIVSKRREIPGLANTWHRRMLREMAPGQVYSMDHAALDVNGDAKEPSP